MPSPYPSGATAPSYAFVSSRTATALAERFSLCLSPATHQQGYRYFRLNGIEPTDTLQRFDGYAGRRAGENIVDFSPGVRHTGRFRDATVLVQRVITTVSNIAVSGKMLLRRYPYCPVNKRTRPQAEAASQRCSRPHVHPELAVRVLPLPGS
jgi:hypothetical protein